MRIWILFLGFIGLVALSSVAVPVHFDEAQYTTWLVHQDFCYQTKGPLVTAVQSVTHGFEFLPQLVQVRLPAWIAWLLSGFLLLWLGRLAGFDHDASRRLLILYVTSPMLFVLGMVHTTDIWLVFFMLLTLCAFASILHCRPNQQTELWWLLMGCFSGILAHLRSFPLPWYHRRFCLGHFENATTNRDAWTLYRRITMRFCDDTLDPLEYGP